MHSLPPARWSQPRAHHRTTLHPPSAMAAAPGPAAAAYAAALRAAEADPGLALELLRLQVPPRALRCPGGVLLLTLARLASVGGWGAGLRPVLPALRGRSERPLRAARSPGRPS